MRYDTMRIAIVVASALGCTRERPVPAPQSPAVPLQRNAIAVGGDTRVAHLHVPAQASSRSRGAVFVFHGGEGDGPRIAAQTTFRRHADQHGFLAVFPNARAGQWNDGRSTTSNQGDDLAFVRALIEHVVQQYGIDRARIFATGPSNGGMFTYRLACEATASFAAFAPVIANLPVEERPRCQPSRPAPLLIINGTADRLMPWNGGEIPSAAARGMGVGGRVISTPETVRFWANANGCESAPQDTTLPDTADDGTVVVQHSYRNCRAGSALVFYEIRGGGHNWPGSTLASRAPRAGNVSRELDASAAIVAFFRRYGL